MLQCRPDRGRGRAQITNYALTAQQLDELSRSYDVGAWTDVRASEGGTNLTYFVTAESGQYVLRQSRPRKAEESLRVEVAVLAHLGATGFPAPAPIPTRGGEPYATFAGRFFLLASRFEGGPVDRLDPPQLAEAAHALGTLHDLMRTYAGPTHSDDAPRIVDVAQRAGRLDEAERQATAHLDAAARDRLAEALGFVRSRIAALGDTARLPRMMIHGSYRASSLLFADDRLSAVLDFDATTHDSRYKDIARALLAFCDDGLDPERCRTFVRAYRAAAPIPADEPWDAIQALEAYRIQRMQRHGERLLAKPDDAKRSRKLADKIVEQADDLRRLHASADTLRAALAE